VIRDPLADVADAPLFIVPRVLDALRAYRQQPRLANLPGIDTAERTRLGAQLDALADRLLAGVEAHPSRFWVMRQVQHSLAALETEDSAARAQVGGELERLMAILGAGRADILLSCYLDRI
jgi:hypothetical protein